MTVPQWWRWIALMVLGLVVVVILTGATASLWVALDEARSANQQYATEVSGLNIKLNSTVAILETTRQDLADAQAAVLACNVRITELTEKLKPPRAADRGGPVPVFARGRMFGR